MQICGIKALRLPRGDCLKSRTELALGGSMAPSRPPKGEAWALLGPIWPKVNQSFPLWGIEGATQPQQKPRSDFISTLQREVKRAKIPPLWGPGGPLARAITTHPTNLCRPKHLNSPGVREVVKMATMLMIEKYETDIGGMLNCLMIGWSSVIICSNPYVMPNG